MPQGYSPARGLFASVVLAALTLGIFSQSELKGPEGPIHRYFLAIQRRDARAAANLVVGPEAEFYKWSSVFSGFFQSGARYQIVDVRRSGSLARAGIIFRSPDGQELPLIISLRRVGRQWLLDLRGLGLPMPTS
jgi:hypothetical protein